MNTTETVTMSVGSLDPATESEQETEQENASKILPTKMADLTDYLALIDTDKEVNDGMKHVAAGLIQVFFNLTKNAKLDSNSNDSSYVKLLELTQLLTIIEAILHYTGEEEEDFPCHIKQGVNFPSLADGVQTVRDYMKITTETTNDEVFKAISYGIEIGQNELTD